MADETKSHKKLYIGLGIGLLLLAAIILAAFLLRGNKKTCPDGSKVNKDDPCPDAGAGGGGGTGGGGGYNVGGGTGGGGGYGSGTGGTGGAGTGSGASGGGGASAPTPVGKKAYAAFDGQSIYKGASRTFFTKAAKRGDYIGTIVSVSSDGKWYSIGGDLWVTSSVIVK